jgi:hydrogenase maturation protease
MPFDATLFLNLLNRHAKPLCISSPSPLVMAVKVAFVGNPLAGDDGIGPLLYKELVQDPRLVGCTLLDAGVAGLGLIESVHEGDELIIIDAVAAAEEIGAVVLLDPDELYGSQPVSAHDLSVRESVLLLRGLMPNVNIRVLGITVDSSNTIQPHLSSQLVQALPEIKAQVIEYLQGLTDQPSGQQ